jgi:hypothetical protein
MLLLAGSKPDGAAAFLHNYRLACLNLGSEGAGVE